MWALNNGTPYAAERSWIRDKNGAHHWIVVVKATFDIGENGKLTLADEQLPPIHEPEYWGEPGLSSLRYESDMVAPKPGTDIIVNAHAHAPKGKPARSVDVALRVGELTKSLVVHGTRVYTNGIGGVSPSKPIAFTSKPIAYEWAYGGADTEDDDPSKQTLDLRNPIGKGVAKRQSSLVNTPAHSVEYPSGNAVKTGPAGFGALASYWLPRLRLAGTYDAKWVEKRKPLLPADYDERFVLCAPVDQRPPKHLFGGEQIALLNMTPDGLLSFEIPKIYLTFSSRFGSRAEEHRSKLVSVIVEPEDRRLVVAWQTSLHVKSRDVDYLDETRIKEKAYLS